MAIIIDDKDINYESGFNFSMISKWRRKGQRRNVEQVPMRKIDDMKGYEKVERRQKVSDRRKQWFDMIAKIVWPGYTIL